MSYKSGFVAVVGAPNVGKSTFINSVIGQKISIVSPKPQTTRNAIRGIFSEKRGQVIFIDTPGIHTSKNELGSLMNKFAINALNDVDLILYMIDSTKNFSENDENIIKSLAKNKTPIILVVNKIDLVKEKERLFKNILEYQKRLDIKDAFYISALNSKNIDILIDSIFSNLEEGPMYYPEGVVSDRVEEFIIAEIIREKALYLTNQEIPHSIAVIVEGIKESESENLIEISVVIYVEKSSQKKIIIGHQGSMIKRIGTLARKDIVLIMGRKIFLDIWVKVEENWRNKKQNLKRMGYLIETE